MEKKQTAVQWLIKEISRDNIGKAIIATLDTEFKQALQMEREQMIEFAKFADRNLGYGVSFEDLYN